MHVRAFHPVLILALFTAGSAGAQPGLEWRLIDGLPAPAATAVLQDREGFVWVGSHVGLARTDGHTTEVFRPRPGDTGSLVSAAVNVGALIEGRDGTLWVGTPKGLCRRRPSGTRFDCAGRDAGSIGTLRDSNVVAMAEAPDGVVWVGTPGGLHEVAPATLRSRRLGAAEGLPSAAFVAAIAVASDGAVWAGTSGGLFLRPPGTRRFRPIPGLPQGAFVSALAATPSSAVWVGTLGYGLFRVAHPGQPATTVPLGTPADASPARSGPNHIFTLHPDAAGRLWVGTWGGGLLRYDPATGSTARFAARPGDPHALPSEEVVDLDVDAAGGVWAATWDGLAYLPPPAPYRLLTHNPDDPGSLSDPRVTSLLRGPTGELWVGTFGGGLNRCNPATLRCQRYRYDAGDSASLCHDIVLDIALDAAGGVWVATSGAGVCRLDPRTGRFALAPPSPPPDLRTAHVYAVALDPGRDAWIGTADAGLVRVPLQATSTQGQRPTRVLTDHPVYAVERAASGELWAGTLGGGLCRTTDGSAFACFRAGPRGLADDWITSLAAVPGGLWAGSTGGLDWIPTRGRPQRVLSEADLPRPLVACVLPTPAGTWVSTASGLLRLDPRSRRVTADAAMAGLPTRGFLRQACTELGPDLLAFGSQHGVVLFRPSAITGSGRSPTRLTAVLVDGDDAASGAPAHQLRSLTLQPGQGGPTFRFATLNYTAPEARRYVYRLDGFERAWSRPTDRPEVTYPRLPPGRYTFRVRPALQTLASEATVQLRVLAPVWRRPWFLALATAAALAIGVAAFRARVGYLLRIERTRRRIADDLHDDIGSQMSGLALALDVTARTLDGPTGREVRARADEARDLVSELRDTVWVIEAEFDSVAQVVERVRDIAQRLLPDALVDVTTGGHTDWPLSMGARRHLLFFCKEALHNAARHGTPGTVRVAFTVSDGGQLQLQIADDGRGFDPATARPGRGLASLRTRAQALGGTLEIQATPGDGTRISLAVDLGDLAGRVP